MKLWKAVQSRRTKRQNGLAAVTQQGIDETLRSPNFIFLCSHFTGQGGEGLPAWVLREDCQLTLWPPYVWPCSHVCAYGQVVLARMCAYM